jgi:hypothetical protein
MIDFILYFIGNVLLIFTIFYNRRGVSRIKLFSRKWFFIIALLVFGIGIIKFAQYRQTMIDVRVKLHQLMKEIEDEKTVTYI